MKGFITEKDEWIYPDTQLEVLPEEIEVHMAGNGRENIRILFETQSRENLISIKQPGFFGLEIYEMLDVNVKYNETETEEQNGMFVITDKEYEKPLYCTRKAPFRVYDVLKPSGNGEILSKNGKCAACISIGSDGRADAGEYTLELLLNHNRILIRLFVYDVQIPFETLQITNWFSLRNISLWHNIQAGTKEYFDMIRIYAKTMRRLRQTHFFIMLETSDISYDFTSGTFDFTSIKPVIDIFFEEGFHTMEIGTLAMKYDTFGQDEIRCCLDESIKIGSDDGYFKMQKFIKSLADFLIENRWEDKTIFHIADEPDVHLSNPDTLDARKRDYFRIALMLKRYLPRCKIIEAVKTTEFKGAIDIWVPLTTSYEEYQEEFRELSECGDEIWGYVCCVPTGPYLNRFLDINLLRSRLLFWECCAYGLTGYLHWGFNMTPEEGYDPYEDSNVPNEAFHGIFPSGDAYLVYPGEGMPYLSSRFEAQRKGAEDYELLKLLKQRKPEVYENCMDAVFRSSCDFDDDTENFEKIRIKILQELDEGQTISKKI